MRLRWLAFIALALMHAGAVLTAPEALAPVLAGSIYLPAAALHGLGLPVFAPAPSGGWASLSALGSVSVLCVWSAVWWGVAALVAWAGRGIRARLAGDS